jgi:hypothetical protein
MLAILAAQLVSLRAQIGGMQATIDAMAAVIDEAARQVPEPEQPPCSHPETENIGTFGAPELQCTTCQAIVG